MTERIPSRNRKRARRKQCQACAHPYRRLFFFGRSRPPQAIGARQHLDHIIPRSYLRGKTRKSAHNVLNLLSVCGSCHGRKKRAELALARGDWLGFCQNLSQLGWPMDLVRAAARYYGLVK